MAETWNASSTVPRLDQDDGKIATGLALVAGAATLAVWTYFLTGLAAATTWQFNKDVAPGVVKTLATVMGGDVIALVGALAASRDRT